MIGIAIVAGLVVGLLVGGLGGGGAILTVPVLVYALGKSPHEAATSSLVIVGASSLAGLWTHHRAGTVQWGQGSLFGLVGIGGAYLGSVASRGVDGELLLAMFSALLLVVATTMARKARTSGDEVPCGARPLRGESGAEHGALAKVALAGSGVGLLTGFFGVGGGFAIVPALTLALGYCMPYAVGTSLLVIVINSVTSLVFHAGTGAQLDWHVVVPFAATAVVGALWGSAFAQRVPRRYLQAGFAVFLVLIALYTAWRSVPTLL